MFKIYGKEISILSNIFIKGGCRKEKLGGREKKRKLYGEWEKKKKFTVEN